MAGLDVMSMTVYLEKQFMSRMLSVNMTKLVLLDPLMNAFVGKLILENCFQKSLDSEKFRKRSAEFDDLPECESGLKIAKKDSMPKSIPNGKNQRAKSQVVCILVVTYLRQTY